MSGVGDSVKRRARYGVYDTLRRQIVSLDLPPAAALSENELAASLGVSRTPIREALLLLAQDGLVQVFPKVGTFVARVDPAAVAEAQFLREAVETASLRSLKFPLDETAVAALADLLHRQDEVTSDVSAFFPLDEQFHEGLMALAGHRDSWATVSRAKAHLDRARTLGLKSTSPPADMAADHRAVFDAVVAGDLPAAEKRLRQHLSLILADVAAIRRTSPELFVADVPTAPVRRSVAVWR